jgi:hypothetical protein
MVNDECDDSIATNAMRTISEPSRSQCLPLADSVAKVCRLDSFQLSEAVEVPIEKMRGGPMQAAADSTSVFGSRVTMALNQTFSSRRVSHRFLSPVIFRLLQQNRPITSFVAVQHYVGNLGAQLTSRAAISPTRSPA